jgi:hypothetical protein
MNVDRINLAQKGTVLSYYSKVMNLRVSYEKGDSLYS